MVIKRKVKHLNAVKPDAKVGPLSKRIRKQITLYQAPESKVVKKTVKKGPAAKKEDKTPSKDSQKKGLKRKNQKVDKTAAKGAKKAKTTKVSKKGNDRLIAREDVKEHIGEPFMLSSIPSDDLPVRCFYRALVRAIYRKNIKEMQKVFADKRLQPLSFDTCVSFADYRTPDYLVYSTGDLKFIGEYVKLKEKYDGKKQLQAEPNLLQRRQTGARNIYMLGHATRAIEMTRGGREGTNALINYEPLSGHGDSIEKLVENGTTYQNILAMSRIEKSVPKGPVYVIYPLRAPPMTAKQRAQMTKWLWRKPIQSMRKLQKQERMRNKYGICTSQLDCQFVTACRFGHRELALSIAENEAKYYTNELHRKTLGDGKLPDRIMQISVVKKAMNNRNLTPLHTAALNPDVKILERLRTVDPNINIPDLNNWYTIHYASVCESIGPLLYLLKNGVSANITNKQMETPLHTAARAGRTESVKILLKAITDLEKSSADLKNEKSLVNMRSREGYTPLALAVKYNRRDVVKVLIDHEKIVVDHQLTASHNKLTPLMIACSLGYQDIAKDLISKGALVEARDKKKRTSLIHAALNGQTHCLSTLLKLGADIHKADSSGNSCAHYAAAYGWLEVLKMLAEIDPTILSKENDWKINPLYVAYLKGNYDIANWMLESKYSFAVDVNGKDNEGSTLLSSVLMFIDPAQMTHLKQQIQYLVDRGADKTLYDGRGNCLLHQFAALQVDFNNKETSITEKEYREIFKLLIEGAEDMILHKNMDGITPLQSALTSRNLPLFQWMYALLEDKKVVLELKNIKNNVLHELVCLPTSIWEKSTETDKQKETYKGAKEFFEIHLKNDVGLEKIKELLKEENANGLNPILLAVKSFVAINAKSAEHLLKAFGDYMSSFVGLLLDISPESLLFHLKREDTPAVSLMHLTLAAGEKSVERKLNGIMLKTILEKGEKYGKHRELLSMTDGDISLAHSAVESGENSARMILEFAKKNNCIEGVHNSVWQYIEVNGEKKEVNNTLLMAIIEAEMFSLISLLELKKEEWSADDAEGNNVWHYLAKSCSYQCITAMKDIHKRHVPMTANKNGEYALHIAVKACNGGTNSVLEPIEWLSANTNNSYIDKHGRTALHYAFGLDEDGSVTSQRDPIAVVSILVANMNKQEINLQDVHGNSALHLAALADANICTLSMLRKGADVHLKNKDGNTPLALAAMKSRISVALTLIQADSNITDKVVKVSAKEKEVSDMLWDGARKTTAKNIESTIPSEVVHNGAGWEAIVYVLLDTLGKNSESLSLLCDCAVKAQHFNLAYQLFKSLDTVLNENKPPTKYNTFATFAENYKGHFNESSIERTVFEKMVSLKYPLLSNGSCLPLELALEKGSWHLASHIKKTLGTDFIKLKPSAPGKGLMKSLMANSYSKEMTNEWIEQLKQIKNTNVLEDSIELEMPFIYSELLSKAMPPIHWCVVYDKLKWLAALLQIGVNVNSVDEKGRTPLMLAVAMNKIHAVQILVYGDEIRRIPVAPVAVNRVRPTTMVFGKAPRIQLPSKRADDPADTESESDGELSEPDTVDSSAEEGSNMDVDSQTETESEESDIEIDEEEKKKGFVLSFKNNKLDQLKKDKSGCNILHYLVAPFGWENIRLLDEFMKKENPQRLNNLLNEKHENGKTPMDVARSGIQRLMLNQMAKYSKNKNGATVPDTTVSDSCVAHLHCKFNVADDSRLFLQSCEKENDKNKKNNGTINEERIPHGISGYKEKGVIEICPETQQILSVLLNRTDVQYGICGFHNFYRLQLIKRRDADQWIIFTNWGRIGQGTGEFQVTPFDTLQNGLKEFKSIWKAKTGNEWRDLKKFEVKMNKYRLFQRDDSVFNLADLKIENTKEKREKDAVRAFIQDIGDIKTLKSYLSDVNIGGNSTKVPFGRITQENIDLATKTLEEIEKEVKKLEKMATGKDNVQHQISAVMQVINDLSNEFYGYIPIMNFELSSLERLDRRENISKAQKMLNRLQEVETATEVLTAAKEAQKRNIDRIDYISDALECAITSLPASEPECQHLLHWIHNTKDANVNVKGIFEVTPRTSFETFNQFRNEEQHRLLFHGTKAINLISIFKGGFLVDPPNAHWTGRLFGDGIYLADSFAKSAGYCRESTNSLKYMIVCQVALGKVEQVDWNLQDEKPNCDTLHVKGSESPSAFLNVKGVSIPVGRVLNLTDDNSYQFGQHSEYIVRNSDRVLPRYVIMFK